MAYRIWIPVQLAAVALLIAACGTSADAPAETTTAAEVPERPSCSEFCAQLGGFGAGPAAEEMAVEIAPQRIAVSEAGIAGVSATCTLDRECVGAIVLTSPELEYGRADLRIAAGTTGTVSVALSPEAARDLQQRGEAEVIASIGFLDEEISAAFSPPLTLLPPEPE